LRKLRRPCENGPSLLENEALHSCPKGVEILPKFKGVIAKNRKVAASPMKRGGGGGRAFLQRKISTEKRTAIISSLPIRELEGSQFKPKTFTVVKTFPMGEGGGRDGVSILMGSRTREKKKEDAMGKEGPRKGKCVKLGGRGSVTRKGISKMSRKRVKQPLRGHL